MRKKKVIDEAAFRAKAVKLLAAGADPDAMVDELVDKGMARPKAAALVASAKKAAAVKPIKMPALRARWEAIHREAMADADYRAAAGALKELDRLDRVVAKAHRVKAKSPKELLQAVSAGELDAYKAVAVRTLLDGVEEEPDEEAASLEELEGMTLAELSARIGR